MKDRYKSIAGLGLAAAVFSSGCIDSPSPYVVDCQSKDQAGHRNFDMTARPHELSDLIVSARSANGDIINVELISEGSASLTIKTEEREYDSLDRQRIVSKGVEIDLIPYRLLSKSGQVGLVVDVYASCLPTSNQQAA